MRRFGCVVFMAALFGVTGAAGAGDLGRSVADKAVVGAAVTAVGADSFAATSLAFPDGVVGRPDVTYAVVPGFRPLKLDLYLPPKSYDAARPRPVIVYIHGGGWLGGGPRRSAAYADWPRVLASIAAHGYVVASVSYRFSNEAPFPAAISDVKAAIRFLRAHAGPYHLDPGRFVTLGQSAGGHLAALAAVTCGVKALEPAPAPTGGMPTVETTRSAAPEGEAVSDCVQGAVAWFGIYDFATLPKKPDLPGPSAEDLFLHCTGGVCDPAVVRAASPETYVTAATPPMFLMHGAKDRTVPLAQSVAMEARLRAAGVRTDLVIFKDADHSWINPTPEETREVSKEALRRSLDFIDALIGDGAPAHGEGRAR